LSGEVNFNYIIPAVIGRSNLIDFLIKENNVHYACPFDGRPNLA